MEKLSYLHTLPDYFLTGEERFKILRHSEEQVKLPKVNHRPGYDGYQSHFRYIENVLVG